MLSGHCITSVFPENSQGIYCTPEKNVVKSRQFLERHHFSGAKLAVLGRAC